MAIIYTAIAFYLLRSDYSLRKKYLFFKASHLELKDLVEQAKKISNYEQKKQLEDYEKDIDAIFLSMDNVETHGRKFRINTMVIFCIVVFIAYYGQASIYLTISLGVIGITLMILNIFLVNKINKIFKNAVCDLPVSKGLP